jgi:hypothetical protein
VGDNPRTVSVTAGQTTRTTFAVTCTAASLGSIQVSVVTSGSNLDPDGYTVSLDGGPPQAIAVNGSHTFDRVPHGSHQLSFADIAPQCRVGRENGSPIHVTAGATTSVEVPLSCFSTDVPGWRPIALPVGFVARGLWASSPSDLFVTGNDAGSSVGMILHYNGHQWTEQFRGGQHSEPITAAWGTSPTDVFAVSYDLVLRYDGQRWSDVGPHEDISGLSWYEAVWGASSNDVFVGGYYDGAIPHRGLMRHFDDTVWSPMDGHGYGYYGIVRDITGTSPTDVYVIGEDSSYDVEPEDRLTRYTIRHYDGSGWSTSFETIQYYDPGDSYYDLRGIWAISSSDVFAVARGGHILHYDGTAWAPMTSPTSHDLTDVWGTLGPNMYAVGSGGILRYDGAQWSSIGAASASRVWGTATDVFVLSGDVILHGRH